MIVGLLIGLVLGVAAGWLVVRYRYAARVAVLEEARAALPETMKALAADALATNNESFLQLAKTQLEVARKGAYSELSTQVRQLAETQVQLRDETGNLVSALRDRPNVRGRWGEIQLRRVVEMAGMLEHCDFETQAHVRTHDGGLRPDLVVRLPGSKTVVVDSKFAGQAYLESLSARDDEERVEK